MTLLEQQPRLLAHDIVKTFGANRALKGVDLTVGDGEVVGLIGENGAGKSTILNIVSGVLPFDSGTLQLDGRDIARSPIRTPIESASSACSRKRP